jgi:hypothetical protein
LEAKGKTCPQGHDPRDTLTLGTPQSVEINHLKPHPMPFSKRRLSSEELSKIDFSLLNIESRRIPGPDWDWAVNPEQEIYCTQLISNTYEMREGVYWYLLLAKGRPFIFLVDAFRSQFVDGHTYREAFLETQAESDDLPIVEHLASNAHEAVSHNRERINFVPSSWLSTWKRNAFEHCGQG